MELNALNEELKASEEAKTAEDVIEHPIEETPTATSEVVEEQPIDTTEVVENLE